jgi:tetratricopeptide (TPR) repeat protein
VAAGLQAAHEAGIVHRDLKPANVMVDKQGHAFIMDFGIARTAARRDVQATNGDARAVLRAVQSEDATRLAATMAGAVVGTMAYMAPEQARGEEVDQRADLYAFGLILYDLLAGRHRFERAQSATAELQHRLDGTLANVRSAVATVPDALDRVITRCTQADPAARYQTTAELVAALDALTDAGRLRPIKRVVGLPLLAATVVLMLGLGAGLWYYQRQFIPPPPREPVSVVIADFVNTTGDPTFDRTLEPVVRRVLEDSGFVSAYDRSAIIRTLGVRGVEQIDDVAAREIAVKQGLGVVLSGSIDRQGNGYGVSLKAVQAVTGNVIADTRGRAGSKDQVLTAATRLVNTVRSALGDDTSESDQLFKMASMSATSLDVVRLYAAGREAASTNRYEEARSQYAKAVELDPKFGIGYQALAAVSLNLGATKDAEKYAQEALRHLDGMTEREVYSIRGLYYLTTGDHQQCVKEYGDLIAAYPADVAGHNNLALCSIYLRDIPRALTEMRRVVTMLPKRDLYRVNLALYSNYAGEFPAADREARAIQTPDVKALTALAFSQLGQGQPAAAKATYDRLAMVSPLGASVAAAGLGDLAAFEGRFGDAARILRAAAVDDIEAKRTEAAASKLAAAALADVSRGRTRSAVDGAADALLHSSSVKTRFLAGRVYVEAGEAERARPLVVSLGRELQAEPQAYAKILEAGVALKAGDARQAVRLLTDANTLLSTWMGHFDLGRAYLALDAFPQADSEFDRCLKRRGEALSLFLDDEPTYALFPMVYSYQGRVRKGLQLQSAADAFSAYLAIRGQSTDDPVVSDVRRLMPSAPGLPPIARP